MQAGADRMESGASTSVNPGPRLTKRASLSGYISSTTPARDLPSIDGAKFMFDVHGKGNVRVIVEHRGAWRKIIRYKEDSLYKWGFLRRWRGTVFSHPFMWQQMLYLFLLACFIAVITYYSFEQDKDPKVNKAYAEKVDLTVISGLSTAMNTLLSFVVAMFVRKAVIIWWEMNNTYMYKIWSTVNRLCLRMAVRVVHSYALCRYLCDVKLTSQLLSALFRFISLRTLPET